MVEKWPHTFNLILPGAPAKDANGNSVDTIPIATLTTLGRAKVGGGQNEIISDNGDTTPYNHSVSFPYFSQDFTNGILIWRGKEYSIIRFRVYQNRCKAWI